VPVLGVAKSQPHSSHGIIIGNYTNVGILSSATIQYDAHMHYHQHSTATGRYSVYHSLDHTLLTQPFTAITLNVVYYQQLKSSSLTIFWCDTVHVQCASHLTRKSNISNSPSQRKISISPRKSTSHCLIYFDIFYPVFTIMYNCFASSIFASAKLAEKKEFFRIWFLQVTSFPIKLWYFESCILHHSLLCLDWLRIFRW